MYSAHRSTMRVGLSRLQLISPCGSSNSKPAAPLTGAGTTNRTTCVLPLATILLLKSIETLAYHAPCVAQLNMNWQLHCISMVGPQSKETSALRFDFDMCG